MATQTTSTYVRRDPPSLPDGGRYVAEELKFIETAFKGHDISGKMDKAANLSDVANPATARTNLGVLAKASNLSDVASVATARTNLGVLASASNLSDVASASSARTNLGLAIGTNVQAASANLSALDAAIFGSSGNVRIGAGQYFNFGGTFGSAGYGFRDNWRRDGVEELRRLVVANPYRQVRDQRG
jgi:hypothetical protein